MATETWKVMIALAVGLVVFGLYVSVADVSLGPVGALVTFVLAILFSAVLYVTMRFGYRLGNKFGQNED